MPHARPALRVALCLACALIPHAAAAQGDRAEPHAQSGFMIEIDRGDGCRFAPITGPQQRGSLLFILQPADHAPDAPGRPAITKVTVNAERAGEVWRVKVLVGLGEFYDAGELAGGEYTLRTGEQVLAQEVARLGVSPFRVAIVRGDGRAVPRVTNRTRSISVERVEGGAGSEPYRLSLRNNSGRDLLSVHVNTYKGWQHTTLKWSEGEWLRPLVKSGGTHEFRVQAEDRACSGPAGARAGHTDKIEIASAVFTDGSYEGASGLAALVKGRALGNRENLRRVLAALKTLEEREDPSAPDVMTYLGAEAAAMNEAAEQAVLAELIGALPPVDAATLPALNNFIRHGMHEIRVSLSAEVSKLSSAFGRDAGGADARKWLAEARAKYESWYGSARAVAAPR